MPKIFVGTFPEELGSVLYRLSYTYVHQSQKLNVGQYSLNIPKVDKRTFEEIFRFVFKLWFISTLNHLRRVYMVTCHAASISDFLMCLGSNIHRIYDGTSKTLRTVGDHDRNLCNQSGMCKIDPGCCLPSRKCQSPLSEECLFAPVPLFSMEEGALRMASKAVGLQTCKFPLALSFYCVPGLRVREGSY